MLNYVEYGKKTNMMMIYFFKIQSNESLTAGLAGAGEWETLRKTAAGF